MRSIWILALLFAVSPIVLAQTKAKISAKVTASSLEARLIAKEKQKFDAIKNGEWLSLKDMFAEDYLSIGYRPDGTVKINTKAQSFSGEFNLPPGIEFTLSDFKVISINKESAIITYVATGPIKVQATSVWAKRVKVWKTIFYQATMIK